MSSLPVLMAKSSVFTTHKTQAVRIPAEARFPGEVKLLVAEVVGNTGVLIPADSVWEG